MSGWRCRSARAGREPFPERLPHELNHLVLTGTLLDEPREARSPRGDTVTMLRLGFPVRDPERPEDLWTLARCGVEVPAAMREARRAEPAGWCSGSRVGPAQRPRGRRVRRPGRRDRRRLRVSGRPARPAAASVSRRGPLRRRVDCDFSRAKAQATGRGGWTARGWAVRRFLPWPSESHDRRLSPCGARPWSGIAARSAAGSCSTSKAAPRRRGAKTASPKPGRAAPSLSAWRPTSGGFVKGRASRGRSWLGGQRSRSRSCRASRTARTN